MKENRKISLDLPVDEYDRAVDDLECLYVFTTSKYNKELPLIIADSPTELAALTGRKRSSIMSMISKYNAGFIKSSRFVKIEY